MTGSTMILTFYSPQSVLDPNLMHQIQQMSQTIQKNEQQLNMQKLLQQQAEFDQQIAASQVNMCTEV